MLFALALALRLLLILLFPQTPQSDGEYYMLRAAEMVRGMGYQEAGHPTAFWPVGYPAAVAAAMLLTGPNMAAPVLLNLLAAPLILWLVLKLGRTLAGGEAAARWAGLLYALYPAHIAYTGAPLSETVSTALTIVAFALLVLRRHRLGALVLAGLVFGLATLMRAQVMLFPIGIIALMLVLVKDFRWQGAVRAALAVHLALAATLLPWALRNQAELGAFVPVSTNGGVALVTGANDLATGDHMAIERTHLWAEVDIPWEQRVERQVELDRRLKDMAWAWIAEHPGRWLALGPVKMALLWRKDSDAFWGLAGTYPEHAPLWTALQWGNQLYYLAILLLALGAFAASARGWWRGEGGRAPLLLLAGMPVFVTLLAFGFTGQIRYHYPAMPFLIVAAGWSLAALSGRFAKPAPKL